MSYHIHFTFKMFWLISHELHFMYDISKMERMTVSFKFFIHALHINFHIFSDCTQAIVIFLQVPLFVVCRWKKNYFMF